MTEFHTPNGAVRAKTMKNLFGLAINQIETVSNNREREGVPDGNGDYKQL